MSQPIALRDTVEPADVERVARLLEATGFFRPDEVVIGAELIAERLTHGPASGYELLFADDPERGRLLGYACYGPIPLTVGSWDLYWIAVAPEARGRGLGRVLLGASEARIAAAGGCNVWVDTSGRPDYTPTRAFYERCGYRVAARLADFYAPGDDKVIFHKALSGA
ncbi:MAG TPA: N-acetyltransferase [Thermoanaerobaculia bacterium]|nr:N-acetyltransferase [Thermoanaerobaculia bacterium]